MSGVGGHTRRDRSCKWRRSRKRDVDEPYEFDAGQPCVDSMESQEGHQLALEWRGKSAKPHGNRTESVRFGRNNATCCFVV